MKIGVFVPKTAPSAGGGHSFQSEILRGLSVAAPSQHQFVELTPEGVASNYGSHPTVQNRTNTPLNLEAARLNLDVVWHLSPLLFQFTQIPFIYTVWDLQHRLQPFFPEVSVTGWTWESRDSHYRTILPRAARIVTGTRQGKNEISAFYGISESNIKVIPFPAPCFENDATAIEPQIQSFLSKNPRYLFYPAQFWPHKNHANLLQAYQLLAANHPNPPALVLTGSDKGNLGYIQSLATKLGISDSVYFAGFVSRASLKCLYTNATALVFPSFFGPDNIPPLEAFALGCPVAAAEVPGAKEQLGEATLFFDPTDPSDIAHCISRIIDDEQLACSLRQKGLQTAERLSVENYIGKVTQMLDEFSPIRRCWQIGYTHP